MVRFVVEDRNGERKDVEVPEEISLSLMEVLRASEYNLPATCGGMALCATCHVEVLNNREKLSELSEAELYMLDSLPDSSAASRLACQLRIGHEMDGMVFKIVG
jgi:2Fe-2S ferredoxin